MSNKLTSLVLPVMASLLVFLASSQTRAVDEGLPEYQRVDSVSGRLSSVGSDTLANLVVLWGEQFRRLYPGVSLQIQAAGSSTAPPALAEGIANLGPMSRFMTDGEIQLFEARHGYRPTPLPVAIDTLAVFVHRDNPVAGLTLAQLDAIFSSTRKCGFHDDISAWGQLGNDGSLWRYRDIQLFGRNSVSGTYGYFKDTALCRGDYKKTVNEQPGSASVVQAISTSLNSIGYSGIGYRTASVKPVPLARYDGGTYFEATAENALSGDYPLARFLYIYVNKAPGKPLPAMEKEFLRMVLSQQGQRTVEKDGYIPLPLDVVERARVQFDLN